MKRILPLVLVVALCGCPVQPQPPSTQPVADQQQQILNTANALFQFNKALLNDLHLQGTINDADWKSTYAPGIGAADAALQAWQANIDKPGSVEAQAQFAAAAADVALFVIEHMRKSPAAVSQSSQKLKTPRPTLPQTVVHP
jgi:hypothetical protein